MKPAYRFLLVGVLVGGLILLVSAGPGHEAAAAKAEKSYAIPEAQGVMKEVQKTVDGKTVTERVQVRYKEAPLGGVKTNWEKWPSYADDRKYPAPQKVAMPAIKGDPAQGRKLFMNRGKGPCTGCHLIQGDDVWPAGNISVDLSTYGDRNIPEELTFNQIYDARVINPITVMPPWGTAGVLKPEEIVHIVAFLKTQKGPLPPEKDPRRNPNTRPKVEPYYGDNLDPTVNPAIIIAEDAMGLWNKKGPAGKACADCHAGGPQQSMKGVATKYPTYVKKYKRVMSIEDFLSRHTPDTTGMDMLVESADNLAITVLVKMQSNGMPVNVDVKSGKNKKAYERGMALYNKKVGLRNHACADCHDAQKGGGKYLGGRLLGVAQDGFTKHFPLWRTNFQRIWDMRKRFQWCMLPLGMNYLPADAVEYAELELYLTAFDNGKPISVPGIRH